MNIDKKLILTAFLAGLLAELFGMAVTLSPLSQVPIEVVYWDSCYMTCSRLGFMLSIVVLWLLPTLTAVFTAFLFYHPTKLFPGLLFWISAVVLLGKFVGGLGMSFTTLGYLSPWLEHYLAILFCVIVAVPLARTTANFVSSRKSPACPRSTDI